MSVSVRFLIVFQRKQRKKTVDVDNHVYLQEIFTYAFNRNIMFNLKIKYVSKRDCRQKYLRVLNRNFVQYFNKQ